MKTVSVRIWAFLMPLVLITLALVGCPPQKDRASPALVPVPSPQKPEVIVNVITDATGVAFTWPITIQRIVSLAPAITENIKILKAQDRIVGRTDFCKMESQVASIGNLLEPSIERIVNLKPDLVLATKDGNRPQVVEKLRSLNITVFVFTETNSWTDIEYNFRLCGKLLGKSNEVEEIIKPIQVELTPVTADGISPLKVFVQLNINPLMTAGRNTFIDEIINHANGRNIAYDSILPWPALNIEEIIIKNPDVIIISDMGHITEQARQMWAEPRFADIGAVKNRKIYLMDSDLLCQPTPVNFIKAVRQMREHLK